MIRLFVLTATLALLTGCGDGGAGQDWAGLAAYRSAQTGETITEAEMRDQLDGDFNCDEQVSRYFVSIAADRGDDPLGATATLYYLCGEELAVEVNEELFGADAAAAVRRQADEVWSQYDDGGT